MAIVPPDPGKAILLAQSCEFDPETGGFRRLRRVHFLVALPLSLVESRWEATVLRERTVSLKTFNLLRAGEVDPANQRLIRSPAGDEGDRYALVDDGFEARAIPA